MGLLNANNGPSSADDAWISLSAKNIVTGKGYSTSKSYSESILFDPFISTGPTLVLPAALSIYAFGPLEIIPGLAQLFVFVTQLIIFMRLFVSSNGWAPTLAYTTAMLLSLIVISLNNWYFGALLGEPVAFGFLILGAALLANAKNDNFYTLIFAGICLSLAFLTKQISSIAAVGIVLSYFIVSIYNRNVSYVRQIIVLVLSGLILPALFEIGKLSQLGLDRYINSVKMNLAAISSHGLGRESTIERWDTFIKVLDQSYFPPMLALFLAIISSVLFVWFLCRCRKDDTIARFYVFSWAGAFIYVFYIIIFSTLRQRYFWLGLALGLAALFAPVIILQARVKVAALVLLLSSTFSLGIYDRLESLYNTIASSSVSADRLRVIQVLDKYPETPYAAEYWSSIYDVVYLRRNEGMWVFGSNVQDINGKSFIAITNKIFTNVNSVFYINVNKTCTLLTNNSKRIKAYRCGSAFWTEYPMK